MKTFLSAKNAVKIDNLLMEDCGFSIDQLMELAGQAVAVAVQTFQPIGDVVVVCGPGNNGGDGLVASRHLAHFGRNVTVVYPKPGRGSLFDGLQRQLLGLGIPFCDAESGVAVLREMEGGIVVDAVFGFSFDPSRGVRPPFASLISAMSACNAKLLCVDVPSGWDVEMGQTGHGVRDPDALISLTAPKLCAKTFKGVHFLGGRFVPPKLAEEFHLVDAMSCYKGTNVIASLT